MTGINWRDAETNPPTKEDLEKERYVTVFDDLSHCGIRTAVLSQVLSDDKWCRCSEFKAHIESTLNPPEPQPDSLWVYAPLPGESDDEAARKGRRWPNESDGDGYIIWQWTQRTGRVRPIVGSLIDVRDDWSECSDIAWMRIPPCPPPPKRELPAIAIDVDTLPVRFTMRDGSHWTALDESMNVGVVCIRKNDGRLQSFMVTNSNIVHVGGWLTAEELEALKK